MFHLDFRIQIIILGKAEREKISQRQTECRGGGKGKGPYLPLALDSQRYLAARQWRKMTATASCTPLSLLPYRDVSFRLSHSDYHSRKGGTREDISETECGGGRGGEGKGKGRFPPLALDIEIFGGAAAAENDRDGLLYDIVPDAAGVRILSE